MISEDNKSALKMQRHWCKAYKRGVCRWLLSLCRWCRICKCTCNSIANIIVRHNKKLHPMTGWTWRLGGNILSNSGDFFLKEETL